MPDELWNEVRDIVQETGIKTIPIEKKCKKAKWLSGEALQIAVKRREVKSKGEKERSGEDRPAPATLRAKVSLRVKAGPCAVGVQGAANSAPQKETA